MARVFSAIIAVVLILLAGFCVFGFLASFEPGPNLVFRIGYPVLGIAAASAGFWLLLRKTPDS